MPQTTPPMTRSRRPDHPLEPSRGDRRTAARIKADRRRKPRTFVERLRQVSRTTWTVLIAIAVVIGFFAIILSGMGSSKGGSSQAVGTFDPNMHARTVGTTAPAINALRGSDGKTYSLAQYTGKAVLLEFFAPWCPHCQAETSTLNRIQATDVARGVQVLSVSASPYGRNYDTSGGQDVSAITMDDMQWFHDTFNLNYPVLFDPSLRAVNAYGLVNNGYPTYYLINAKGVITFEGSAEIPYDQLQTQIEQTLKG